MELNKIVEDIKDMLQDSLSKSIDPKPEDEMDTTKGCNCNGCTECKDNGGCEMEMCKGHDNMYKAEDITDEEISKGYESDNEEEDNWDNIQKACWSG